MEAGGERGAGMKWRKGGTGGGGKLVRVEGPGAGAEEATGAGAGMVVDEAAEAAAVAEMAFGEREVKGRAFGLTIPGELRCVLLWAGLVCHGT